MKTREIWLANLDPSQGFEQSGERPVLIISGDAMNSGSGLAIVCPLTTKVKNFAGDVILTPDEFNGFGDLSFSSSHYFCKKINQKNWSCEYRNTQKCT